MIHDTQKTFYSFLIDYLKTSLSSRHTISQNANRRLIDILRKEDSMAIYIWGA